MMSTTQIVTGGKNLIKPVNGYSAPPVSGLTAKFEVNTMFFAIIVQITSIGWE
jgi:hypothetical protein